MILDIPVEIPVLPHERHGYISRRVDTKVDQDQAEFLYFIAAAASQRGVTLRNGKSLDRPVDVVRFLIERAHEAYKAQLPAELAPDLTPPEMPPL